MKKFFSFHLYPLLILVLGGGIFFSYLFFSFVFYSDITVLETATGIKNFENIKTISWTLNADWMMHLSQVQSFAGRGFFTTLFQNPLYFGEVLSYPFLVNFLSGMLFSLTGNLVFSMNFIGVLGGVLLLLGSYFVSYFFLRNRFLAFLPLFILFFGAGTHAYHLLTAFSFSEILELREYQQDKFLMENGYFWKSVLMTSFIPQRAISWGIGISFLLYALLFYRLEFLEKIYQKNTKKILQKNQFIYFFVLGAGFGCLAYIHTHSFFFAFLFLFLLMTFFHRYFLYFVSLGIGAVFASSFFLFLLLQKNSTGEFFSLFPLDQSFLTDGFLVTILKNWGVLVLVPFLIFWKTFFSQKFSKKNFLNTINIKIFLVIILLFVLSLVVQFQPNYWDNTKIWLFIFFFFGVFLLQFFQGLYFSYQKKSLLFSVPFFLVTVFSGVFISLTPFLQQKNELVVFSDAELKKAKHFNAVTDKDELVLSSDYFHFFTGPLTPNQIFMGYRGWINSYGLDTQTRIKEMKLMYSGSEKGAQLLKKYGIDIVVIDYFAIKDFGANEAYFEENFELVFVGGDGVNGYRVGEKL